MSILRTLQHWLAKRSLYVSRGLPYSLSWQLRTVFAALHINCVIDVGAHHGEFGMLMRQSVGFQGRIVSFEPSPSSYQRLLSISSAGPQWLAFPFALGPQRGHAELRLFEESVFNSLLPTTSFARDRFGRELSEIAVKEVEIRTLDDCLPTCVANLAQPRVFLKLDTQGYDQRVLQGAEETLAYVVALQSELAVRHLYEDAPDFVSAMRSIVDLGFAPVGFFPVSREVDGVRVIEFDVVAVRSDLENRLTAKV